LIDLLSFDDVETRMYGTRHWLLLFADSSHFAGVIPYLDVEAIGIKPGGFQRGFVVRRDMSLRRITRSFLSIR
jgi:hypothetical protein